MSVVCYTDAPIDFLLDRGPIKSLLGKLKPDTLHVIESARRQEDDEKCS